MFRAGYSHFTFTSRRIKVLLLRFTVLNEQRYLIAPTYFQNTALQAYIVLESAKKALNHYYRIYCKRNS